MQQSTEESGLVAGSATAGAPEEPPTGTGTPPTGARPAGVRPRRASRRRVPVWVFIAVGVLLVGLAGTSALMMSNRGGGPVPEAEVVTLPVPTPTIDPIARAEGSAFYEALPSTVLDFVLADSADATELVTAGALEGYLLEYTDGSATVALLAGQWESAEQAETARAALSGSSVEDEAGTASPEPSDGASSDGTPDAESGDVTVDGVVVGTYTMETSADGDGVLTWSNDTVVLQLSGPADELHDLYAAFPL
ncbi:hypothetical protein [Actinotalea sp.]|uniref:hypothetical protein n=1 Tax=Actinotalea sp. TaxID=1872145 RepID=UPI003566D451